MHTSSSAKSLVEPDQLHPPLPLSDRRSSRSTCPGLVTPQASVDDLCSGFYKAKRKFYPSRQRFTLPPADGAKRGTPLVSGKRLKDYDLQDGCVLIFKDLGPQVSAGDSA